MMTRNQLVDILNTSMANGVDRDIRLVCDDGSVIYVTPCCYGDTKSVDDCEYFLIDGDMPWLGGPTVDDVLKVINNYSQMKADNDDDKKKLADFRAKYEALDWPDDTFGFYSDWHKDIYGFRPRF